MTHLNFELMENNAQELHDKFLAAKPFEHVCIDNALNSESLKNLMDSIAALEFGEKSSDYIFAKNKYETPGFNKQSPILSEFKTELLSERFEKILRVICGKEVFVDKNFLGGGVHRGGAGSFLDMHADFNRHPVHNDWMRELNILLYLNNNYNEKYGGHLELENAKTHEKSRISPVANRLVIMLTKEHTLHGYRPINFPEGTFRTSIAAYAYSINVDYTNAPSRTTLWVPDQANLFKRSVARIWPLAVKIKNRWLGSSTAKRAMKEDKNT